MIDLKDKIATTRLDPKHQLQLSAGLTEFPDALFELEDCLEILDLNNNQLSDLPKDIGRFKQLRILFLTGNQFEHIPSQLADCPKLEMISFKANKLKWVDEDCLPLHTRWLILSDNQISRLPESIGKLHRLQKLALGGNSIEAIPKTIGNCQNLELARFSANQLHQLPDELLRLPKLSWLAFAGNPVTQSASIPDAVPMISINDLDMAELLGQGASGLIYRATWHSQNKDVAVKLFKGDITSDGYPADEIACCLQAGAQKNLIPILGQLDEHDKLGLVMELIPSTYRNLGLPPSLISCTRDTFPSGTCYDIPNIAKITKQMAALIEHLQAQHISHGDIYAHNTMIDEDSNVLFGDFGAASDLSHLPEHQQVLMHAIEWRALGCLIDDLLLVSNTDNAKPLADQLRAISVCAMNITPEKIPTLKRLLNSLSQ